MNSEEGLLYSCPILWCTFSYDYGKRVFSKLDIQDHLKSAHCHRHERIKRVENVIRHLAGERSESQAGLVAKYLDKKGPEFTAAVSQHSKQLRENRKFTPEQTAALTAAAN